MAKDEIIQLNVCAPPELTDPIASFLIDNKSGGVLIEDISADEGHEDRRKMGWQWIRAYFSPEMIPELKDKIQVYLSDLHSIAKNSEPPFFDLSHKSLKDWSQAWKSFFKTTEICPGILIKPTWESVPKGDHQVIELDPGMAFGTGGHPTTRLSSQGILQVLEDDDDSNTQLGVFRALDIGCGSGILSLVAAKLGVPHVVGIDIDPVALDVARENVKRNNMSRKIEIRDEALEDVFDTFDLVIANIIAGTLIELREEIVERVNRGGYLVLSGILRNQGSVVKDAFLNTKVEFVTTMQEDSWSALVFRKI